LSLENNKIKELKTAVKTVKETMTFDKLIVLNILVLNILVMMSFYLKLNGNLERKFFHFFEHAISEQSYSVITFKKISTCVL
jgi:hypothetical protein